MLEIVGSDTNLVSETADGEYTRMILKAEMENDELYNKNGKQTHSKTGHFDPPLSIDKAAAALKDIKLILKPPQDIGAGYKDPELDFLFHS